MGGTLVTAPFAGRTIDLGADGFLARRGEATNLVDELGWRDRLEAIGASGSNIWLGGALYELPQGLVLGVPTSSAMVRSVGGLTWRARECARRDEVLAKRLNVGEDISIGEILRTKLGPELAYTFIEPMVGGIQAGRIDELSAKSVFPLLYEAATMGGSLMKALKKLSTASVDVLGSIFQRSDLLFTDERRWFAASRTGPSAYVREAWCCDLVWARRPCADHRRVAIPGRSTRRRPRRPPTPSSWPHPLPSPGTCSAISTATSRRYDSCAPPVRP